MSGLTTSLYFAPRSKHIRIISLNHIYLSIYLSVYLSIYISISIDLFIYHLSDYLFICPIYILAWEPSAAKVTKSYSRRLPALEQFYRETEFSLFK